MKGLATVTAVDDTSITVTLDGDQNVPDAPASITASFTETTQYRDGDAPVTARPTIVAGDKVLIAVERPAGGDAQVIQLEAHPVLEPAGPSTIAVGTIDGMNVTDKVQGEIAAVNGDTVTVTVAEGSLPVGRSIVVHVPSPVAASTIGTPCGPPPSPAVGDHGSFLLGPANADGTYPAVLVELRHG